MSRGNKRPWVGYIGMQCCNECGYAIEASSYCGPGLTRAHDSVIEYIVFLAALRNDCGDCLDAKRGLNHTLLVIMEEYSGDRETSSV